MYGSGVLVILNNYARPQNMPAAISAWRGQSVKPTRVVVVDNTVGECMTTYPNPTLAGADDVWRWRDNCGCFAHLAPALVLTGHRYVLLADDDVLPGNRAIENLLETAADLEDSFATLGQEGRLFKLDQPAGSRYSGRSCPVRGPHPVRTHITCQAHLVRADLLAGALALRGTLLDLFGADADRLCRIHDDFLLSLGGQMVSGLPSYVLPKTSDPSRELILSRPGCSDASSVYRRPNHFAERAKMVDMCLEAGWKPNA